MPEGIPSETPPIPATRLEHVALAVPDLDAAIAFFSKTFGLVVSETIISREQGVRMAYLDFGNAKLELMEPVGDASPIAKFVSQNPSGGIHHICIETDDAEKAIAGAGGAGGAASEVVAASPLHISCPPASADVVFWPVSSVFKPPAGHSRFDPLL